MPTTESDLAALDPHWFEVTGAFKPRGGIAIAVVVKHDTAAGA